MSFVKPFLVILFVALVLTFAALNQGEQVTVRLWPGQDDAGYRVPMVWAIACAFLFGAAIYFLITLAREIRLRTQITRLRREKQSLLAELHQLRGAALDDLPSSEAEHLKEEGESVP